MGQNDGEKKLRQLRKEIAQIKTVERERELGIHGETKEAKQAAPAVEAKAAEVEIKEAAPAAEKKAAKTRKAAPSKTAKAKGTSK
jgi:hypothetical protein